MEQVVELKLNIMGTINVKVQDENMNIIQMEEGIGGK